MKGENSTPSIRSPRGRMTEGILEMKIQDNNHDNSDQIFEGGGVKCRQTKWALSNGGIQQVRTSVGGVESTASLGFLILSNGKIPMFPRVSGTRTAEDSGTGFRDDNCFCQFWGRWGTAKGDGKSDISFSFFNFLCVKKLGTDASPQWSFWDGDVPIPETLIFFGGGGDASPGNIAKFCPPLRWKTRGHEQE